MRRHDVKRFIILTPDGQGRKNRGGRESRWPRNFCEIQLLNRHNFFHLVQRHCMDNNKQAILLAPQFCERPSALADAQYRSVFNCHCYIYLGHIESKSNLDSWYYLALVYSAELNWETTYMIIRLAARALFRKVFSCFRTIVAFWHVMGGRRCLRYDWNAFHNRRFKLLHATAASYSDTDTVRMIETKAVSTNTDVTFLPIALYLTTWNYEQMASFYPGSVDGILTEIRVSYIDHS